MPDADVVVGGFPCQGFSQANRLRTLDDDRNKLYRFFYNIISVKQPKFFIAENVKGILSLGNGSAIKQIVSDFEAAGYTTSIHLVNMADYGIPQTRQRVIIIGQRIDLGKECRFVFPKPTHSKNGSFPKWISIKEAISHFPDPDMENSVLNHIYSAYKVEFRNFTGHRKQTLINHLQLYLPVEMDKVVFVQSLTIMVDVDLQFVRVLASKLFLKISIL